jgi:arylsulfatase A-like enzyme
VPSGLVTNEIVHIADLFPTIARITGAEVPTDRVIDGIDQLDFFTGKQATSNREGLRLLHQAGTARGEVEGLEAAPRLGARGQ